MKKIKKVTRRAFTEKQLDMLEQYHYLYKKLWRIGLSEDESEYNLFTGTKQDILFGIVRFQRS